MKRYFRIWMITIILILLFTTHAFGATLGDRTLKYGTRGDDVRQLQQLLKNLDYFNYTPTGYYGSITTNSVINFQRNYSLAVDGIAGKQTIYKLKYENGVAQSDLVYTRLLRRGSSGSDVISLQKALKELGCFPQNVNTTGYYGSITESAVKTFQSNHGISPDGITGRNTINTINNALTTDGKQYYTVKSGDTLWSISHNNNVSLSQLISINNFENTVIYPGQRLVLPDKTDQTDSDNTSDRGDTDRTQPYVSYKYYTVKSGDTLWGIAYSNGLDVHEIYKANNLNSSSIIRVGQTLKIPVYNIPVKSTPGSQYGELLDWWTEAKYVMSLNSEFTVEDFYTGIKFNAKRTYGANHADCEPLTSEDTRIMLNLWNTYHTSLWSTRPVIIHINGRKLAASASAMCHAGLDAYPSGVYVSNRSGDYGYGQNYDAVKGNNADGHFDIHFLNSTRHKDGQKTQSHQDNIMLAAGKK